MVRMTPIMEALNRIYDCWIYSIFRKLILGEIGVNNFSFLAAMMLSYQPIRSLATINMRSLSRRHLHFKRISEIIDGEIKIKDKLNAKELVLNIKYKFPEKVSLSMKLQNKAIKNINLSIKGIQ